MSRVGKIARLPEQIREQINHRLQDGEEGRQVIAWLNSIDEVKAVLSQGFDNCEITDGNLCEWKRGGYADWQAQQTTLDEARRIVSEGGELAQTGKGALADNLAAWMIGRYILATRKLVEMGDDPEAWKLLRAFCQDLVALRRGEHSAEWLRIERERLQLQRQKNARERKKATSGSEKNPPLPALSEEEKERRFDEIFGIDRSTHPMYGIDVWNHPPDPAAPPAPLAKEALVQPIST